MRSSASRMFCCTALPGSWRTLGMSHVPHIFLYKPSARYYYTLTNYASHHRGGALPTFFTPPRYLSYAAPAHIFSNCCCYCTWRTGCYFRGGRREEEKKRGRKRRRRRRLAALTTHALLHRASRGAGKRLPLRTPANSRRHARRLSCRRRLPAAGSAAQRRAAAGKLLRQGLLFAANYLGLFTFSRVPYSTLNYLCVLSYFYFACGHIQLTPLCGNREWSSLSAYSILAPLLPTGMATRCLQNGDGKPQNLCWVRSIGRCGRSYSRCRLV